MKSSKPLKEIKITPSTIYIQMTAPGYGQIFVDGKPIGVEMHGERKYFLDEYDEDVYIRYGISFDADDDDEEYYPVEESKKLVQILLPKLKFLGAEVEDNGYGVSQIAIPADKARNIVKNDYPKYLGNGKFEYKGKTITYKQSAPGSNTYQIYDSNDNLIRTVNSVNKNFEYYMQYLRDLGKTIITWDKQQISPYDAFQNLTEIKVQPTGAATLSPDILATIKDDVISYITDELNDTIYDLLDYYFDSYVRDTFESFIIDQMIFNNYSITRNGKEILMSHNTNRDLITEEDIREYIDGNPSLQKYLKDLIYKFYIKHVDVECLTRASIVQAIKDKQEYEDDGEEYSTRDVSRSVERAFWDSDCDSTYIGDVLDGEDFNLFLQQEFKQADVIEEIQVTPAAPPFPLKVTYDTFDNIAKSLTKRGYTWANGKPIESINPWERKKDLWIGDLKKDEIGYLMLSGVGWDVKNQSYINPKDLKILQFFPKPNEFQLKQIIDNQKRINNRTRQMQEIQVQPSYTFGDNPKTLNGIAKVETDMFGKGYTLALVDLGSHYTFIPYGGQPFVVLIPKQYIEPTEKEYYPISQDGVQQLKDLLRQGKIEKAKSIKPTNRVVGKIKEALKKKIKTKLNESETAYHGTSHYFTSFRKEGIGGGSGAQAYGWGLYFGKDPAIAKGYVGAGGHHGKTKPLFQGKTAEELGFQYENEIFFGLPSGMTTAQDYINYAQEMISILEEEADFDGKNEILKSYRQFIDIIKDLEIEQEPMLYLYKVTLFPNKTPDYLNWDSDVPQSQLDKINQQAQKDNLDIQIKPNIWGSTLYRDLQKYFDSPKEASMFLLKAGIDGVTHSNGTVRIVFDDRQVQIDKIYKSKEIQDVKENKKSQLNEYSDKIVKQMTDKWQKEMRNTLSDADIKAKLNRFDQIKQNIPAKVKLGQIVLPDKFTKPDPNTKKILNPQDILAYTWKDLERVLDAYGEKAEKTSKDFATVQDADLIEIKGVPIVYSGNGVKVYEGSNYENCIKLNYAFKFKGEDDKIYSYAFCIGRKEEGSNQYYSYRFGRGGAFRSFYFVADTTQSADIKGNPQDRNNFLNWYHFFVIHAFDNGTFGVTDAVNTFGSNHEIAGVSWEDIGKFMIKNGGESGQKAWDKIKNHKDIFKYVDPSSEETDQALIRDQILNIDQFKNLNRNQKRIYISRRADQPNAFNSEMFKVLDPELKNLALRSGKGFIPTFDDLKGSQALLRSYASFRFTRAMDQIKNNQSTPVIVPLPFVPYLNDSEKQQYLETFDGNLTFQYIEKYFGENAARTYVNEQAKDLKFLPAEAIKYIQDPKLKQLYEVYAKLLEPWQYGYDTNISEEELEKKSTMPLQTINPIPLNKEQWTKLSSAERKAILDLTEKFSGKSDYLDFLYALPIIVKDGNNRYVVLPENTDDINTYVLGKWEIVDENGNVVKDIPGESSIGDLYLSNWYPDASNGYKKVYNIKDLKVA